MHMHYSIICASPLLAKVPSNIQFIYAKLCYFCGLHKGQHASYVATYISIVLPILYLAVKLNIYICIDHKK